MFPHRGGQPGLFPESAARTDAPSVAPFPIGTRGRLEFGVRCPECGQTHRHNGLGLRRGPCGSRYYVVAGGRGQ